MEGRGRVLRTSHPMIWLPSGRPRFACSDATLERVTIMASMIRPIWPPTTFLERPSARIEDSSPLAEEDAESMLFSNKRYKRPTEAIRNPPVNLQKVSAFGQTNREPWTLEFEATYITYVFSILTTGRRVKTLIDWHATNQVAIRILLCDMKPWP